MSDIDWGGIDPDLRAELEAWKESTGHKDEYIDHFVRTHYIAVEGLRVFAHASSRKRAKENALVAGALNPTVLSIHGWLKFLADRKERERE